MTNLLTGLRVSQKILLIVAVPLATLLMISSILIYQEYQNASRLYKLERLLQFAPSLTDLAHELQKERGLSVGYLSSEGQTDVAQKLKEQHLKTSQFRDLLDLTIATVSKTDYGQELTDLIEKAVFSLDEIDTKRIEIRNLNISLKDIRGYYTTTIASLHEVVSRMAVLSNNAAVQRQIINYTSFLQAKEYAGLERAQGLAGFSRGQFLPENHKNLINLLGQQEAMLSTFRKLATTEQLALYNAKVPSSVIDKVARMRDIAINKTYQLENISEITGIQWFDAITKKIDLMKIVEIKLSKDLQLLSAKLASESTEALIQFGILFLVAFSVSGAFASLVGHNLSKSIGNTTKQMSLLATNDLSVKVTGSGRKDELGDMAKAVQVFKENAIENRRLEADKVKLKEKSDEAIRKAQEKALSVGREMITKTTDLANSLRDARDIQKDAIDNISDGFVLWGEDDRLIMCNSKYKSIYRELDDILSTGLRFEDFIRAAYQRGVYEAVDDNFEQALEMRVKRHRKEDDPIEEKLSSGRWIRVTKGPASDGRVVGIITDITTQKQSENAIKKLAETDALTGLPNRRLFTENLQVTIKTGKRTGKIAGILLLDLDRFKSTNDTMGHPTGDALLCEVANRLRECVRKTDTVARLGGDEFAIITSHVKELEDINTLANRIKLSLAKPYHLDGQEVHSSVSIGITVFPADSRNSDQLLRNADVALYKAKEAGRGGFMFFDSGMDKEISTQRTIEQGLREAINENQLELYYQPQVDVLTGKVIGAEALLRWSLPERGVISPEEFIPIAETCGLIIPLGEWIIDTACRQAQEWLETGLSPIMMAVNISPLQFKHHGLIGLVRKALEQSQLDPQLLELEITEGVAIEHSSIRVFEKIKRLGVKMAIDDFGTGYSSLSQLIKFPVNRLKIDKSFVSSRHHMAVCAAIISLGKNLNLDVIAEGVETSEQLDALTKLGCHEMQGYLFAPAMPAKSFADFHRVHNPQEHICKITSPQLQVVKQKGSNNTF
ncbi:MAG: EAL domain-containing protein [Hyphomicrobiales bacterium]|nr:EAL domain-containing protein [Hyphomicrobiales bacterium]